MGPNEFGGKKNLIIGVCNTNSKWFIVSVSEVQYEHDYKSAPTMVVGHGVCVFFSLSYKHGK